MIKRTEKEFYDMHNKDALEGVTVTKDANNPLIWLVEIQGPAGSPYEGGKFCVQTNFTENYPFKMPIFKFTTQIFHPNVNFSITKIKIQVQKDTGEVCQEMLGQTDWRPTMKIVNVIQILIKMLSEPNPDSAVNEEAANLFNTDKKKFDAKAAEWTQKFAK